VDDHDEFNAQRARYIAALGVDQALQEASLQATILSDRHGYSYVWDWLGLPIIQMPTDVLALQEIILRVRPQIIVEAGVARGGSLVFFASMLELVGEGQVVGIDVDIRSHNRLRIEGHPMAHRITLIEGPSIDPETVARVVNEIPDGSAVMVVLDSNHSHEHVLEELHLYSPLVTRNQYLVVGDTVIESIPIQEHRPRHWGPGNSPATALEVFLRDESGFEVDRSINEKLLMSSSRGGYLRRK